MNMTDLSLIYESMVIQEMDEKVVDYLIDHEQQLPFSNIFGDKMRMIIPLPQDPIGNELLNNIRKLKDFSGLDLSREEVVRRVKLDPKYGKGDYKEQRINLGRVINALNIPSDKKKEYLNWFAKYGSSLKDLNSSKYSIILSRSPIDVVRMSDHKNIQSCHSRGGSYFACAIQEAITGGAIAYLVKTSDIEPYENDERFQTEELFQDRERGVKGIVPLSRMRLRRVENVRTGEDFAFPDSHMYGITSVPYYDAVGDFIKSKQNISPAYINDNIDDLSIRGGTYMDKSVNHLIKDYFKDSEDEIENLISRNDIITSTDDDFVSEEDISEFLKQNSFKAKIMEIVQEFDRYNDEANLNLEYDIYDEEEELPYVSYSGNVLINLKTLLIDKKYYFDYSTYVDSLTMENPSGEDEKEKLGEFVEYIKDVFDKYYDISIAYISMGEEGLSITFINPNNVDTPDVDEFSDFVSGFYNMGKDYQEFSYEIKHHLIDERIASKNAEQEDPYSILHDLKFSDNEDNRWENIKFFDSNPPQFWVNDNFFVPKRGSSFEVEKELTDLIAEWNSPNSNHISSCRDMILKFLKDTYRPKLHSSNQMMLSFESYFSGFNFSFEFKNFKITLALGGFYSDLKFIPSSLDNNSIYIIDHMDKSMFDIKNIIAANFFKFLNDRVSKNREEFIKMYLPTNIKQIQIAYGKYIN